MLIEEENFEPSEEELTNSFNEIVNGESPQPVKEEQDEVQWEEEENQEEENQELQSEKAKTARVTQKKNKWKDKYNQTKQELDALKSWERDIDFEDERERDLAILEAQNEVTYAKNRSEEISEQEIEDFYMVNTDAKEIKEDIDKIMDQYWMDINDAYKFHLSKTDPQKLYDQQKANQAKGWNGMMWSQWGVGSSQNKEKSANDLEAELISSFNKWNRIL